MCLSIQTTALSILILSALSADAPTMGIYRNNAVTKDGFEDAGI